MQTDERKCPKCAETIKSAATLCRYCGSIVEPVAQTSESNTALSAFKWLGILAVIGIIVLIVVGRSLPANDGVAQQTDLSNRSEADGNGFAVADDNGERPGPFIDGCYHLDNCGYARILGLQTRDDKPAGRLVEAGLEQGLVDKPKGDATDLKSIRWVSTATVYALCSTDRLGLRSKLTKV